MNLQQDRREQKMTTGSVIDIHAHVFPDAVAQKAADSIGTFYGMNARHSGTVSELTGEYDRAGINRGCIHSVAVTPHYIPAINRFIAETVRQYSGRFTGFAAIHPEAEDIPGLIDETKAMGLKGFKIHPDMQRFALDSPEAMDMFSLLEGQMPVMIHTGDRRFEYSNPKRMKRVLDTFPRLTCICAHLGGWSEWEDAWKTLAGYENVYVDTSSSLYAFTPEKGREMIRHYSRERVLFGTDYPMWTPGEELDRFRKLQLSDDEAERILYRNAADLLQIT